MSNKHPDEELIQHIVKVTSKQAVQSGLIAMQLPESASKILASQLAYTVDLLRKGSSLTPASLTVLLAGHQLGIAQVALDGRHACLTASLLLCTSLAKTAMSTVTFWGVLITAAGLLADCYSVDKACGVSDAVKRRVDAVALPAAMWLEQGVTQMLRQSAWSPGH